MIKSVVEIFEDDKALVIDELPNGGLYVCVDDIMGDGLSIELNHDQAYYLAVALTKWKAQSDQ